MMGEELSRWVTAARPGLPWALAALGLLLLGYAVKAVFDRKRIAEARRLESFARQAEAAARFLHDRVDRITTDTCEIDMRVLTAHAEKAKFNPLTVLTDVRERIATKDESQPDWAPGELAAMPEADPTLGRSRWPMRGIMPRLRPRRRATELSDIPNPAQLGARIARLRAIERAKQFETRNA